jgi:hypothetical protein
VTLIKSIVVCLVLANVGYFLWAHGIAKSSEAPAQGSPVGSLKLVSESPDAARALVGDAATPSNLADDTFAGSGGEAGTPRMDGRPGAGAATGSGNGTSGSAGTGTSTPAPLLTNVKRCISVGPFRDMSEAAHAATTLRGGGYDPRQRVADGEVWAGVWVYLPLAATRAAGDQILAKLKAGGFDDALEMPGPNDGSVISLGLYSDPKRAQARVAQAQALGFNPGIADRKRSGNVYWIDIDLKPTDSLLNPADLQGESGRIVRLEVKGCPSASGAAS